MVWLPQFERLFMRKLTSEEMIEIGISIQSDYEGNLFFAEKKSDHEILKPMGICKPEYKNILVYPKSTEE